VARNGANRAVRGLVSGRVQGVGFRWFVQHMARSQELVGHVRNLPDGRVEFRAQGSARDVEYLVKAVNRGPAGSRVDGVESYDIEIDPALQTFDIRY